MMAMKIACSILGRTCYPATQKCLNSNDIGWILTTKHNRIYDKANSRAKSTHGRECDSLTTTQIIRFITDNTMSTRKHLTPEIKLHLITPECQLWYSDGNDCLVEDPFWAFYWPGGQALTRYLLDNPPIVSGKTVLDVGAGCAASSIAAGLNGATRVIANDICPVAIEAAKLNAALNCTTIETDSRNLIGHYDEGWDVILLGDMFYDDEFTDKVSKWIEKLHENGKDIFIGDPGRSSFSKHPIQKRLKKIFSVDLLKNAMEENSGMTQGYVWRLF